MSMTGLRKQLDARLVGKKSIKDADKQRLLTTIPSLIYQAGEGDPAKSGGADPASATTALLYFATAVANRFDPGAAVMEWIALSILNAHDASDTIGTNKAFLITGLEKALGLVNVDPGRPRKITSDPHIEFAQGALQSVAAGGKKGAAISVIEKQGNMSNATARRVVAEVKEGEELQLGLELYNAIRKQLAEEEERVRSSVLEEFSRTTGKPRKKLREIYANFLPSHALRTTSFRDVIQLDNKSMSANELSTSLTDERAATPVLPEWSGYSGEPFNLSERRPLEIVGETPDSFTANGFYYRGAFWTAVIPKTGVAEIIGQRLNFSKPKKKSDGTRKPNLSFLNHVQARLKMQPDSPLLLYPVGDHPTSNAPGGEPAHRINDFVYTVEAVGPHGRRWNVADSLLGNLAVVHRFLSICDVAFERILRTAHDRPPISSAAAGGRRRAISFCRLPCGAVTRSDWLSRISSCASLAPPTIARPSSSTSSTPCCSFPRGNISSIACRFIRGPT